MRSTTNVTAKPTHHEPSGDEAEPARRPAPAALVKLALHHMEVLAVMAVGMMVLGSAMALGAMALGAMALGAMALGYGRQTWKPMPPRWCSPAWPCR